MEGQVEVSKVVRHVCSLVRKYDKEACGKLDPVFRSIETFGTHGE